jgi:hypothetical protein
LERHDVINRLSSDRYRSYLEIGVDYGTTFNQVKLQRKVGVDPLFKVPASQLDGATFNLRSDDFFRSNTERFDCVFIDGLHTYEQSKRDFLHAQACLNPGGIVILDDCFPADDLAALPDLEECLRKRAERGTPDDRTWMGDVYKTVVWINDCTEYAFAFVEGTLGVVVVWKVARPASRHRWLGDEASIASCDYPRFKTFALPWRPLEWIEQQTAAPVRWWRGLLRRSRPRG